MKHIKTKVNQHIMHQSQKKKAQVSFLIYIYIYIYKKWITKNILFKKAFTDNNHKETSKAFARREILD